MTDARSALLSLAAEFEEMSRHRTLMENAAYRYAAAMARQRAAALPAEANTTSPVSQDPGSGREALGALVREVWVAWASEQPDPKPSWLTGWDELDDGQREVDMRIGEAVAAAERRRLYAELGDEHYVIFTEDGWTTEHSAKCRLSGRMFACAVHTAVARLTAGWDHPAPDLLGRWRIAGIDSEGLPDLERTAHQPHLLEEAPDAP